MAHITEFSITSLAGRDKPYCQKLDSKINVFYGLNGSGKTSLLRLFNSAMANDSNLVRNVPFRAAEIKIYSIDYDRIFTYTLEKTVKKTGNQNKVSSTTVPSSNIQVGTSEFFKSTVDQIVWSFQTEGNQWKIEPAIKDFLGKLRHGYLPTSRLYVSPFYFLKDIGKSEEGLSEEQLDTIYSEALQYLWQNYDSDLITAVNKATQDGLANILKALLSGSTRSKKIQPDMKIEVAYERISNFLKRQGSNKILGSLSKFEQAYKKNPQLQSVVVDINRTEQKIANIMTPRNKLETLISRMFSGNKTIHFGDRSIDVITNQNENIGIGALSSGEKHILRIFIETLRADNCTFMVDEPEISMHVDWQKELIKTMHDLNPSLQLILATHSPEIMADIDDSQIFRL